MGTHMRKLLFTLVLITAQFFLPTSATLGSSPENTVTEGTVSDFSGTYVAVITGTRDRNIIKFRFWAESITAYELRGTWIINAEDNELEGSWIQPSHDASGQWNLTKSD